MKFPISEKLVAAYKNKETTLNDVVRIMMESQKLKELCESYQQYMQSDSKTDAKNIKTHKIPVLYPAVSLLDGKSRNHVIGLTGYGMIDYDKLTEEQIAIAKGLLAKDNRVVMAAKSISGQGLHVIFHYTVGRHIKKEGQVLRADIWDRVYKKAWNDAAKYFRELLLLVEDSASMNMVSGMVMSYDEELLYNPDAESFVV